MPDQEPEELSAQVRLWNAMKTVRSLDEELHDIDLELAAHGLQRAYRRLYGTMSPPDHSGEHHG